LRNCSILKMCVFFDVYKKEVIEVAKETDLKTEVAERGLMLFSRKQECFLLLKGHCFVILAQGCTV